MAIPTNFNSIELTSPLPASFEKWFPIGHIYNNKWRAVIDPKYLPLSTVAVGEDISYNLDIPLPASLSSAIGTLGIVGAMVAIRNAYMSLGGQSANITLSRSISFGNFGTTQPLVYYINSPRFGYQIGTFKHQAYFEVRSIGTSVGGGAWADFATVASIEYATNCKLKRLYVSHGKILSIYKKYVDVYIVRLFEKTTQPNSDFKLDGKLQVWTFIDNKYKKIEYDLSSNVTLSETGELIFEKDKFIDIEKISSGDFFILTKPWVIENPSFLFEYGLNKDNGFYQTNEQQYKVVSSTILGVWIQAPKDLTYSDGTPETVLLWHLYTDLSKDRFPLPNTPEQEKLVGEASDIKGTLKEGIALAKLNKDNAASVRVVIFGANSEIQNCYPPSLIGEFVNIGDYFWEIVGHPRSETIEVKLSSSNGNNDENFVNFIDTAGITENIDVFQQKFWFINELYYGYPYSHGLWEGTVTKTPVVYTNNKIETNEKATSGDPKGNLTIKNTTTYTNAKEASVVEIYTTTYSSADLQDAEQDDTTTVEFTTTAFTISSRDVPSTNILDQKEKNTTKCNYLTERFYKDFTLIELLSTNAGQLSDDYYKKYDNLYFYNMSKNKTYKIFDIDFKVVSTDSTTLINTIDITMVVMGDVESELSAQTTTGYIFLGEPFKTYSGYYGEMSLSINTAPSLNASGQNYAYMYGNYYSGTYILPEQASQFAITSARYGDNVTFSKYGDLPYVLISVPNVSMSWMGGCIQRIGTSSRDYVFFLDPDLNAVVFRQGSCDWRREHQKKLVITINPEEFGTSDVVNLQELRKYITKITYNVKNNGDGFWFVKPQSKFKSPSMYESYYVSNGNNVCSSLTAFYNLDNLPSKGIWFPFEFFSFEEETKDTKVNKVIANTYFTSDLLNSGECLEKVYGADLDAKNNLKSLISGIVPNRGALSTTIDKIYCVDENKVLQDINYMWVYATYHSEIFLFYKKSLPKFYLDAGKNTDLNPSLPSVFVLRSDNSGDDFHSPSVLERDKSGASASLMLLYDFDLRCAAISVDETTGFVLGFAYDRGKGPLDSVDENGNPKKETSGENINYKNYCFLAMYAFNLRDIFENEDNYYACFDKDNKEINTIMRLARLKTVEVTTRGKNEHGENKDLYGQQLKECETGALDDYNVMPSDQSESSQYMVSILNQNNAKFDPRQISVSVNSDNVISLFINVTDFKYKDKDDKDGTVSGIISLSSKNSGITWIAEDDDDDVPIVYGNSLETNPYILDNILFVINEKNELVAKDLQNKSVIATKVVAYDVLKQNIYASKQENGQMFVYYYNKDGNLSALLSKDGGATWTGLNNW